MPHPPRGVRRRDLPTCLPVIRIRRSPAARTASHSLDCRDQHRHLQRLSFARQRRTHFSTSNRPAPAQRIRLYTRHRLSDRAASVPAMAPAYVRILTTSSPHLRRLLGLNPRSVVCVLFTEKGIVPLHYRRAIAALPPNHYAHIALLDTLELAQANKPGWLVNVLKSEWKLNGTADAVLAVCDFSPRV
jgi:hypothetical protein